MRKHWLARRPDRPLYRVEHVPSRQDAAVNNVIQIIGRMADANQRIELDRMAVLTIATHLGMSPKLVRELIDYHHKAGNLHYIGNRVDTWEHDEGVQF